MRLGHVACPSLTGDPLYALGDGVIGRWGPRWSVFEREVRTRLWEELGSTLSVRLFWLLAQSQYEQFRDMAE